MAKQGPFTGQRLAGKYLLGDLLGQGGMGAVYKAADTRLNRAVAVKVMSPAGPVSAADLQQFTQMFEAEALRLAGLKHQSIPHIYDYFEEAGKWFLVMEFIEGVTLEDHLKQCGGRLAVQEALQIGLQLARVLEYLHTQNPPIIFRDLKPANVMMAPGGQVYLIDFGIARLFTPGKDQDTVVARSRGYAPPEQYGLAQTTVRSDIYSLGATLHHLLSGSHPANNSNPFVFAPLPIAQPAQLGPLIQRMVAQDEHNRPASMRAIKEALKEMVDERSPVLTSGPQPGSGSQSPPPTTPAQSPPAGSFTQPTSPDQAGWSARTSAPVYQPQPRRVTGPVPYRPTPSQSYQQPISGVPSSGLSLSVPPQPVVKKRRSGGSRALRFIGVLLVFIFLLAWWYLGLHSPNSDLISPGGFVFLIAPVLSSICLLVSALRATTTRTSPSNIIGVIAGLIGALLLVVLIRAALGNVPNAVRVEVATFQIAAWIGLAGTCLGILGALLP